MNPSLMATVPRRYFVLLSLLAFSLLATWQAASRGTVTRSIDYLSQKSCERASRLRPQRGLGKNENDQASFPLEEGEVMSRVNTSRISAPAPVETGKARQLWRRLESIFDEHLPSPIPMEHPNPDSVKDLEMKEKLDELVSLDHSEARSTRESHQHVVSKLLPYPTDLYKGAGIVMLAGGRYSEYAATSLATLRKMGSTLPVELWSADESEEVDGWCEELAKEGIACRKLENYIDLKTFRHPYQWKILTFLFSSFEEMIFLDADCIPLRDPDVLLKSEVYNKAGGKHSLSRSSLLLIHN